MQVNYDQDFNRDKKDNYKLEENSFIGRKRKKKKKTRIKIEDKRDNIIERR